MPKAHNTNVDKNFDDLIHRFKRNIYDQLKGRIRLAVIERDLAPYLAALAKNGPASIVDAGGGQGQFSLRLAALGHELTLCDISAEMLTLAKTQAEEKNLDQVRFLHTPLQALAKQLAAPCDLLICHAVLEWMAEPHTALTHLSACLKPGGILSLAFFNENSIIYKNLLRANFRKVTSGEYGGMDGSLTPLHPLKIDDVFRWCDENGFDIEEHSGIRVFHDYMANQTTRERHPDALIEAELAFSKQEPYRSLGRYIHVVARRRHHE